MKRLSKRPEVKPTPRGGKKAGGISEQDQSCRSTKAEASPVQTKNPAPSHLRPDTAGWWRAVANDYALEAHHLRILTLAAESWDRGVEAREAIARHGTVYVDRFDQPRARPEVAIERDSRIAFARLVRELALNLDQPDENARPPRLSAAAEKPVPGLGWDTEDRRILGLD